jgi:hypothetical protein
MFADVEYCARIVWTNTVRFTLVISFDINKPLWSQIPCMFMLWYPFLLSKLHLFADGAMILTWDPSTHPITHGKPCLMRAFLCCVPGNFTKSSSLRVIAKVTWRTIPLTVDLSAPATVSPVTSRKLQGSFIWGWRFFYMGLYCWFVENTVQYIYYSSTTKRSTA